MYSSEYTSGFSGPAASHLAASLSPRHERQYRTGSWQDAEKVRQLHGPCRVKRENKLVSLVYLVRLVERD